MSLSIKDIVSISGSPGLFRILKSNDNVIVVESMDDKKKRQLIKGNMMVSKLMDVSIYTDDDDSEPLVKILKEIKEKFGNDIPVDKKSDKEALMNFLGEVLPTYDRERVYPSNVKKLVSWYKIISAFEVDLDWEEEEEGNDQNENTEGDAEKKSDSKEEKKPQ